MNSPVLICGAGPTGLSACAFLHTLGIAVRCIDKSVEPATQSRALAIHAGTLECFESTLGAAFVERLISAGRIVRQAFMHSDGHRTRINVSRIPSQYNFILILEQSKTERFLVEYLQQQGIAVERNTELVGLTQSADGVIATLHRGDVTTNSQHEYVMGCDGAHSAARHALEIPFDGEAYPSDFLLADVRLENWPFDDGNIHLFVNHFGVLGCFPLPEDDTYRIVLLPKSGEPEAPAGRHTPPEIEELAYEFTRRCGASPTICEAPWLTRFRVHHRIVNKMGAGRVLLAGDAAHIHSPLGGQGMNTGIQDALCAATHLSIHAYNPTLLLRAYSRKRLRIARRVVRGTDAFTRLGLRSEGWITDLARRIILPTFAGLPVAQRIGGRLVSQLGPARTLIREYRRRMLTDQG